MDGMAITAVVIGVVLAVVVAAWVRAWLRVREDLGYPIKVDGLRRTLPEAWWMLHRAGSDPGLQRVSHSTPSQLHRHLARHFDEPVELHRLHRRADELNEELRAVVVRQRALPRTAQVFDVAAISLGGAVAAANLEAVEAAFSTVGELAGEVVEVKAGILADIFPGTVDGLAGVVEEGVQAVTDPMLSTMGDGFMPIPVGTVVTGGRRVLKGIDHGVSHERIAENAALDLGVQGGATVTGAAIGTFLMPGIGTVVGSVVGGLLGSTVAGATRGRHLAHAREEWMARLDGLGREVDPSDFQHLVSLMDRSLRAKKEALSALRHSAEVRWVLWPSYGAAFKRALLDCAEQDVQQSVADRHGVQECVHRMGHVESASRALYWLRYGEAKESASLLPLLEAASGYRDEHLTAQALS